MARSTLPVLLAAVAAAALTAPAVAAAGPLSPLLYEREFSVQLTAESTSSYEVPRWYGHANCYGRQWHEGSASESWTFKSRRPTRLGAVKNAGGTLLFVRMNDEDVETGVPAGGRIVRASRSVTGEEPGPCGGGSPADSWTGTDCGTKMVGYDVALQVVRNRLRIQPLSERGAPADQGVFRDCQLITATGADGGGWEKVEARLSAKNLMSTRRTVTAKASKRWREPVVGAKGWMTTTTKWTVTFKPVGRRRG